MKLSDDEKLILDGKKGEGLQKALDYLVQLGKAFDAEKMVDITYCHYPAEMAIYKGEIEQLEEYASSGVKAIVPSTTSTISYDLDNPEATCVPEELANLQAKVFPLHKKLGVDPTYTCTPYLLGYIPTPGSYISAVESSAIIWFNSVLGARTNRGGVFTKFSAVTGKTPYMGYLLTENRKGTHLFNVNLSAEELTREIDWSMLGFHIGKIVGSEVPVIVLPENIARGIKQEWLISLGASLATSGSVTLYHIVGVTPEAPTIEKAFHGIKPSCDFEITSRDIENAKSSITNAKSDDIDFVLLGCPHYNYDQLLRVAGLLDGKKIKDGVRFWICTPRMIKNYARWTGIADIIEKSGAKLISDTCPVESHMRESTCRQFGLKIPNVTRMVTDSAKQARYVKDLLGCEVIMGNTEQCVKAAIDGNFGG